MEFRCTAAPSRANNDTKKFKNPGAKTPNLQLRSSSVMDEVKVPLDLRKNEEKAKRNTTILKEGEQRRKDMILRIQISEERLEQGNPRKRSMAKKPIRKRNRRAQESPPSVSAAAAAAAAAAEYGTTNTTESIIEGAKASFYSNLRLPGVCYASHIIAMGEFDQRGGMLKLLGDTEVSLKIPPQAVKSLQLFYIALQYEPCIADDNTVALSPVIDCGPNGYPFQVPLELTFPHDALDTEVFPVTREQGDKNWSRGEAKIKRVTETQITILVDHFTRFKTLRQIWNRTGKGKGSVSKDKKDLRVTVYKNDDLRKAKVYFMNGNSLFEKVIDQEEERLGYKREDNWKEFYFVEGKGGLRIRVKAEIMDDREFIFPELTVMRKQRDSWDFLILFDSSVEILVSQPQDECMITQFCVTINATAGASYREPSNNIILPAEEDIIKKMASKLEPHPELTAPHVLRMMSRAEASWSRTAVESCDHYGGNCRCFNDSNIEEISIEPITSHESPENDIKMIKGDADGMDYAENATISQPRAERTEKPGTLKGPESMMIYIEGASANPNLGTIPKERSKVNGVVGGEIASAATTHPVSVRDESTIASQVRATLINAAQEGESNNTPASSYGLHLSSVSLRS